MIISDLYEIKITSDENDLYLDDTTTIRVQAVDFNGESITGKSIQVVVDKGEFVNNSNSLGKSYIGTLGNNGFTVDYKATEVGVASFNCSIYSGEEILNHIFGSEIQDEQNVWINEYEDTLNSLSPFNIESITCTDGFSLSNYRHESSVYICDLVYEGSVINNCILSQEGCYDVLINQGEISEIPTYVLLNKQSNLQVRVDGWEKYNITTTQGNSPRPLYVNKAQRRCYFSYYVKSQTFNKVNSATKLDNQVIPSQYRPSTPIRITSYRNDIAWIIDTDGSIYYRTYTTNANPTGEYARFDWSY